MAFENTYQSDYQKYDRLKKKLFREPSDSCFFDWKNDRAEKLKDCVWCWVLEFFFQMIFLFVGRQFFAPLNVCVSTFPSRYTDQSEWISNCSVYIVYCEWSLDNCLVYHECVVPSPLFSWTKGYYEKRLQRWCKRKFGPSRHSALGFLSNILIYKLEHQSNLHWDSHSYIPLSFFLYWDVFFCWDKISIFVRSKMTVDTFPNMPKSLARTTVHTSPKHLPEWMRIVDP